MTHVATRPPLWTGLLLLLLTVTVHARAPIVWPDEDPDRWLLAIIDVETTGLTPGFHEMIDIGLIYTDLEGNEVARVVERVWPDHPERCGQIAAGINGFSVERWDSLGALTKAELRDRIVTVHDSVVTGDKRAILVAWNSAFDAAFLDHLFRAADDSWRNHWFYYVMDLPSMAWALGYGDLWGKRVTEELGVEDEPHTPLEHTGITGAEVNLRIYKALRSAHPGMFPPSR